jgi:DAK2 domain fusion protein YloV
MQPLDPSLVRFRAVVDGALAALEARRQEINDLNVFPVADGDTGDNMVLTMRAVLDELTRLEDQGPIDEIGRDMIVESVARAALLGARGNSGVILSQLVRGAAEVLIQRPGELVDPVLVAAALRNASERAYASVREPAEGTILTVSREMADRMMDDLSVLPDRERRLGRDGDGALQNRLLANFLASALQAGEASLKRGPELLPVLRSAGVIDAGAYGLLVVLSGCLGVLQGEPPPPLEHHAPARVSHPDHASSTFRYCTNFAVTGRDLEGRYFIPLLEQIGDSVLVVGDAATLKVHVHTDDPGRAQAIFAEHGAVSHVDVADMHEQVADRAERLSAPHTVCGVLAVVSGDGMHDLFRRTGATPLDGGRTLNPSTYDLLTGIHSVPAEEVIVLPNSPNVRMAAERAADLSEKVVHVVATRSQQAGLAAAFEFDPERPAAENAQRMREAVKRLRTGAVTEAARDDANARFRAGEAIGFVDEELIAWGEPAETLRRVIDDLASADVELVTVIAGRGAPFGEDQVKALLPEGIEIDPHEGGQPSYWWLLSAE